MISPRTQEPIDAKTLRVAFRAELDAGHIKANVAVAQSLYQQAVNGNVRAAIWWTKARMGWKEGRSEHKHEQPLDGVPLEELIRRSREVEAEIAALLKDSGIF